MTINEFRAWLEGFSSAMGDAPSPEQWRQIKAKLEQVRQEMAIASIPQKTWRESGVAPQRGPVRPDIQYGPNTCGPIPPVAWTQSGTQLLESTN